MYALSLECALSHASIDFFFNTANYQHANCISINEVSRRIYIIVVSLSNKDVHPRVCVCAAGVSQLIKCERRLNWRELCECRKSDESCLLSPFVSFFVFFRILSVIIATPVLIAIRRGELLRRGEVRSDLDEVARRVL